MDRYERMRSSDWPRDGGSSNFRRMPGRRFTESQRELLEDVGRITLALAVLALLAAFVR